MIRSSDAVRFPSCNCCMLCKNITWLKNLRENNITFVARITDYVQHWFEVTFMLNSVIIPPNSSPA